MKIRLKLLLLFAVLIIFCQFSKADEGMWIPMLLKELNENEMKAMGMRLSADEIYSINKASMKDAVVLFGRGCTGEIVSDRGLMLTNHHCGYGRIQSHSSVDNDLLTNGFWAMNLNEELPNPGLQVSLLVYMQDVTDEILKDVKDDLNTQLRQARIADNIRSLVNSVTKETHYTASVVPFYYGNQYILMVYEVFKDIRLVGAPPSSVGKFGGDTDNWMWPRHTGDFAWFRIYTDKENKPAAYSEDNVPYRPKYSFSISLKGVEENDFTFVFGYPGSTNQYATSHEVRRITQSDNPVSIEMRRGRMDVMEKYMALDDAVRIQYSAKHASVANFWKKMIGENRGIMKIDGINKKQQLENRFQDWAKQDTDREKKYASLINEFESIYKDLAPAQFASTIFFEGGYAIELIRCAFQFEKLYQLSVAEKTDQKLIQEEIERLKGYLDGFFKDYSPVVDREIASYLLPFYYRVDEKYAPEIFTRIDKQFKSDMQAYIRSIYRNSIFTDRNKLNDLLNTYNSKKDIRKISSDPAFILMSDLVKNYRDIAQYTSAQEAKLDELYRIYMKALMEMDSDKRFYPDANGTLRVAYGNVASYIPLDAVKYNYYTTATGIIEKTYQDYPDYVIGDKLYAFLKEGDFGKYRHADGTMRVAFIATNHTTGGNSGSPVLNADGHLVGINFDRVWEGTMSDLFFDPGFCRNISADIRYVLLITDKYAGATHLIDELKLIE
jgi:hypothetical protein